MFIQILLYVHSSRNRSLLERYLFEQIKRILNVDGLSILMSKLKFLSGRDVGEFCEILALLRVVSTVGIILLILSIMLRRLTNLYWHRFCLHNGFSRFAKTAVLRVLILIWFFYYFIFHFSQGLHNLTVHHIIIPICLINYWNTITFLLVHTNHLGLLLARKVGLDHIICT